MLTAFDIKEMQRVIEFTTRIGNAPFQKDQLGALWEKLAKILNEIPVDLTQQPLNNDK